MSAKDARASQDSAWLCADFVLEQSAGPGEFNFVTIVEWDGVESSEKAKAAIVARHKEINFNPQEMFARLGIRVDMGNYKRIDA